MTEATEASIADITVGLPVRNGGSALRRAIETILRQTYGRFVLEISDNASDDRTAALCESFAAADARVRYQRQSVNLGAIRNFRFVLERATTPLFIWVAHDDWLDQELLERSRATLLAHRNASAAIPETVFHAADGTVHRARGGTPIGGPAAIRIARYLARPADNSRFYGLHRTRVLKNAFPPDLPLAPSFDWVIMALSLASGPHVGVEGVRLNRSAAEPSRYLDSFRSGASAADRWIPTATMTRELVRRLPWELALAATPSLALLAVHQAIWHRWLRLRRILR